MNAKKQTNLTRKLKIGVMGSASGPTLYKKGNEERCEAVGRAIAKHNCMTITGACPGLPHFAAKGAKEAGGFVLGVSPAFSEHEHVREYKSPNEYYDIIIFPLTSQCQTIPALGGQGQVHK